MEVDIGTRDTLADGAMRRMAMYRHRVFVKALGWDLPQCDQGLELDQFDRDDTLYVVARQGDDVTGVARLLPTHRPYLLGELFPQLMGGLALPCSPHIWELSRFTALEPIEKTDRHDPARQVSSSNAVTLLKTVLEVAASHGVQRLITVSPLSIERLLRRNGFLAHRAAPPVQIDGHSLYACWIEVPHRCND